MEFSTTPVGGETQSDGAWQLAYRATPMGGGGEQSLVPPLHPRKSRQARHSTLEFKNVAAILV